MVSNKEFLDAIFGEESPRAHVSIKGDFRGGYFGEYKLKAGADQYFCISTFSDGDIHTMSGDYSHTGSVRRTDKFKANYCIVIDDVGEKIHDTSMLPAPSWVLNSSAESQQWGYIWDEPVTDGNMILNLQAGLINLLAEKDPGMSDLTRLMRLPQGFNTKESRLVDGKPYKCKMVSSPMHKHNIYDMARGLGIDLFATREQKSTGKSVDIDHPILKHVQIKRKKSPGKYDVTCPWVHEHTNKEDTGAAIFTNSDLTGGFHCKHGHCKGRNFDDVVNHYGLQRKIETWKLLQEPESTLQYSIEQLSTAEYRTDTVKQLNKAALILGEIHKQPAQVKHAYLQSLRQTISMTKTEFVKWCSECFTLKAVSEATFYDDVFYVKSMDSYFDTKDGTHMTQGAFIRTFTEDDEECYAKALTGRVRKVLSTDYIPGGKLVYTKNGHDYVNTWSDRSELKGIEGDPSPWLDHFERLGITEHKDHIVKWMAYTLQHPNKKINHAILLGGDQGIGKDLLLTPLKLALGDNAGTTSGNSLLSDFNQYLQDVKYLHVDEINFAAKQDRSKIYETLKPMLARAPDELSLNIKGMKLIKIENLVNCTINVNNRNPFDLGGENDRRIFAVWSPSKVNSMPGFFNWMQSGGYNYVIHYLRHYDCSNFNPGIPPKTEWMKAMINSTKPQAQVDLELLIDADVIKNGMTTEDILKVLKVAQITGQYDIDLGIRWRDSIVESYLIKLAMREDDRWLVKAKN